MLKRIILALAGLLGVAVLLLALGLAWAHIAVRREAAPLPTLAAVRAAPAAGEGGLPVRLSLINTASQAMPRATVLDPSRDPSPDEPYVMSHPSFVLEWADGRLLLVDAGMTPDAAAAFGRPLEQLGGAAAMQPIAAAAEVLGDASGKVGAVVFTHLHTDHVGGIGALCARGKRAVQVPMTEAQAQRTNYTTQPGMDLLDDAACAHRAELTGGPLFPVPNFPGVFVIDAGGHTPGSQIVLATVQGSDGLRQYAFTGDIVNNIDGITSDVPKPFLYRTFIVPESEGRLSELRAFLRQLHDEAGYTLLVSHDQRALEASGVPAWQASAGG
ncbi:MAG: MBL fold metallo-hydrolase [Candidatus Binatia bacterium]